MYLKTKRDRICKLCEKYKCDSELQAQKVDGYEDYGEFGYGHLVYRKNNPSGGKQNRKTKTKSKRKSKSKSKRKITIRKKKKKTYKYKKKS